MFRVSLLWFRIMKSKKNTQKYNKIRGGVEFRINSFLSLLESHFSSFEERNPKNKTRFEGGGI